MSRKADLVSRARCSTVCNVKLADNRGWRTRLRLTQTTHATSVCYLCVFHMVLSIPYLEDV